MDNDFKYSDEPWVKHDAKEVVFSSVTPNTKVFDLGCWTGLLGEKLKKEKNCIVFGVDINKKALELAKKRLDKVFLVDLEDSESLNKILPPPGRGQNDENKFDFITATDVLEHLKNPEELLFKVKKYLKDNGRLIISVPNIAFWTIRIKHLLGNFDYEKTGILDNTHLRFFTKKTATQMLENCGYVIEKLYFTGTKFLPELKAFQFVFICKKE